MIEICHLKYLALYIIPSRVHSDAVAMICLLSRSATNGKQQVGEKENWEFGALLQRLQLKG